jgi:hypothetical protein
MAYILRNLARMKNAGRALARPAIFSDAERADTTSTVANWVLSGHFATKDFCRPVQEN